MSDHALVSISVRILGKRLSTIRRVVRCFVNDDMVQPIDLDALIDRFGFVGSDRDCSLLSASVRAIAPKDAFVRACLLARNQPSKQLVYGPPSVFASFSVSIPGLPPVRDVDLGYRVVRDDWGIVT